MQVGVTLPIVDFGDDLVGVRDYVQAADDLGYMHVRMLDHVLGADPQFHPEVERFPYIHKSYIHEPFTFMGYLAWAIWHGLSGMGYLAWAIWPQSPKSCNLLRQS